jgi:hypothetical protein
MFRPPRPRRFRLRCPQRASRRQQYRLKAEGALATERLARAAAQARERSARAKTLAHQNLRLARAKVEKLEANVAVANGARDAAVQSEALVRGELAVGVEANAGLTSNLAEGPLTSSRWLGRGTSRGLRLMRWQLSPKCRGSMPARRRR